MKHIVLDGDCLASIAAQDGRSFPTARRSSGRSAKSPPDSRLLAVDVENAHGRASRLAWMVRNSTTAAAAWCFVMQPNDTTH